MHTTLASWALVVWRAIESYRLDPRAAFDAAGIDISRLQKPGQRVPFPAMQALWREAVERSGDPCFGLKAVACLHPTSFHAVGYAVMASDTLEDALRRIIRYGRLVATVFGAELREEGQTLVLTQSADLPEDFPAAQDASIDAALAAVIQLCREAVGPELSPVEVGFAHPPPPCVDRFYEFFRCRVRFGADDDYYLVLDKAVARSPLPTANAELALANERVIRDYLASRQSSSLAMRVRARIAEQLPSGQLSESSVAEALHVSARSMQRRLREEGVHFKTILDEMRRELAVQYVRQPNLSMNEIAFMLGYSEPASFTRAFRRWTGVPPSAFRGQSAPG